MNLYYDDRKIMEVKKLRKVLAKANTPQSTIQELQKISLTF